ncbi:MAG: nitrate reductase molybdenum cofactor assembly chaperone [Rhodobacteraceae bacterium]|nr:nitrate reductase molybdenum cofactor assembly chaperone [Paracoccaceae bacterium]
MTKTLRAFSALLCYPTAELKSAVEEIETVLKAEGFLSDSEQKGLAPLLRELAQDDLYDLQERFVAQFDRSRTLSLNLFEHVHGESRDRGGAMVDLLETYRAGGFEPDTTELPDHLPMLLEFLSTRPLEEAKELLGEASHILEALNVRLSRRESSYAGVLEALMQFADLTVDSEAVAELLSEDDDDPDDLEALDAVWEESQVTFGPDPNAGCPQVRDMLAKMDTPINAAPVPPAAAE